jgi:hypothetical protein
MTSKFRTDTEVKRVSIVFGHSMRKFFAKLDRTCVEVQGLEFRARG